MRMISRCSPPALVALAAMGLVSPLQAAPFTNGSFELGTDPGATFISLPTNSTAITGWTVTGGDIDYIGGLWQAGEGGRSLDMVGCSQGTISQTFDTVAGTRYLVSFLMAGNPGGNPPQKSLLVSAADASQGYVFSDATATEVDMGWQSRAFQFTATGPATTLSFTNTSDPSGCVGAALDNVSVMAIASQPAQIPAGGLPGLMLLGLGMLGLAGWALRRA